METLLTLQAWTQTHPEALGVHSVRIYWHMPTVCQPWELWGGFTKTVKKKCLPQCLAHSNGLVCATSTRKPVGLPQAHLAWLSWTPGTGAGREQGRLVTALPLQVKAL